MVNCIKNLFYGGCDSWETSVAAMLFFFVVIAFVSNQITA